MLGIGRATLARRREKVREELGRRGLRALVAFGPAQVRYLSDFAFIATERPMALILTEEKAWLFVPRLEVEHAERSAWVDEVLAYPEYPDREHPMLHLARFLRDRGLGEGRLGVDTDGYAGGYGYAGPRLSEVLPEASIERAGDIVARLSQVKSPEEIELIRESVRWGHLAHRYLQEAIRPGRSETEVSLEATQKATLAMIRTVGELLPPGSGPAFAGFRGQVGKGSALPHAVTTHAVIRAGDVLVTGASANVGGYGSELERTLVVGPPTPEQERFFRLMVEAQEIAFARIRPGVACAKVDAEVRRFFREQGLEEYWRHHTGHGLGAGMHEAPFLDVGDGTVIEPGMVFSLEPGIYVPGFAGFRHSDTILVTESGAEWLTYYPRDLPSLTVDV
ncbi:MAG: Xaa-Pro peptidase family protein [Bacillota bacterium]|nr:Xaa-Pro peptidase family protein [Bacillota bacterium]